MLHIHFGAGRLGLGLVAPFFRTPESELIILNRAQHGKTETGEAGLTGERKAQLLRDQPQKLYGIQTPGDPPGVREVVSFNEFATYDSLDLEQLVSDLIERSSGKEHGVIVTGSVVNVSNYHAVVDALNQICTAKVRGEKIGQIYLVACENTVSAHEVFQHERFREALLPCTPELTQPVHALVDRICVALEEYGGDGKRILDPTVLVRAEEYGSLKLQIGPETEALVDLCRGSRIEFSRHLDVEKKIKGWLLNGTHWLIALTAFQASNGDTELKLNEYLAAHPERQEFAAQVIEEISEGIEIILQQDPEYADFVRDISPRDYLNGASATILRRFVCTEDSISRILARFRKPSPEETSTVESFLRRFFDRVDPAISAYAEVKGVEPPATSHGLVSLCRLIASGTFVDAEAAA